MREDRNELARHVEQQLDRLGARINRARRADLSRTRLAATASEVRWRELAEAASPALNPFYQWRALRNRRLAARCRDELRALQGDAREHE
jgi:hypothetical protein